MFFPFLGCWKEIPLAHNNNPFPRMVFCSLAYILSPTIRCPSCCMWILSWWVLPVIGNNFTKEIDDLDSVVSWIINSEDYKNEINRQNITLIGHSRGGGIVLLKSAADRRISRVITWAGVSDFASRFPSGEELEYWRENGVAYVTNARTNQQMPHYFQFYTNFKEFESSLTIKTAVEELSIPCLFLHGSKDETVLLKEAELLNSWNPKSKLRVIPDANHTFGSAQPWESSSLPEHLSLVLEQSTRFINS